MVALTICRGILPVYGGFPYFLILWEAFQDLYKKELLQGRYTQKADISLDLLPPDPCLRDSHRLPYVPPELQRSKALFGRHLPASEHRFGTAHIRRLPQPVSSQLCRVLDTREPHGLVEIGQNASEDVFSPFSTSYSQSINYGS
jgi:hypothetical protein